MLAAMGHTVWTERATKHGWGPAIRRACSKRDIRNNYAYGRDPFDRCVSRLEKGLAEYIRI
jgi:hypothetical protein